MSDMFLVIPILRIINKVAFGYSTPLPALIARVHYGSYITMQPWNIYISLQDVLATIQVMLFTVHHLM